jgi:hypothetical protein
MGHDWFSKPMELSKVQLDCQKSWSNVCQWSRLPCYYFLLSQSFRCLIACDCSLTFFPAYILVWGVHILHRVGSCLPHDVLCRWSVLGSKLVSKQQRREKPMVIKHILLSHRDFVLLLCIRSFSVATQCAQCAPAMLACTGASTKAEIYKLVAPWMRILLSLFLVCPNIGHASLNQVLEADEVSGESWQLILCLSKPSVES